MSPAMVTLYGIANCDKCRAARKWFGDQEVEHQFHDVRKDGLTAAIVRDWLDRAGAETVINKRGKTWRELSHSDRDTNDPAALTELILAHPTLTKRPIVDTGSEVLVGYDEKRWAQACKG